MAVVQKEADLLPHCDFFRVHMPERQIIKYWQTQRCDNNTQMRWWRWGVVITSWCAEATFSLTGEDGA